MPWLLETLTPLFIGSGQEPATPLDFILESNGSRLRWVPLEDLLSVFDDPSPFVRWIESQPHPSLHRMLDQPWAAALKDAVIRQSTAIPLFTTQANVAEVARFFRNGLRRPYIPGTTLKGALRTALLYDFLMRNPARLSSYLQSMRREEDPSRDPGAWLERQIFRASGQDATRDILRVIAVADSAPIRLERLFVGEVQLIGSRRTLSIHVEALMPQCRVQVLPVRVPPDQKQALKTMQDRRPLWDPDLTALYDQEWPAVARACYRWSQDLLEAEIDHWQRLEQNQPAIAQDVVRTLRELQTQNREDRPIMRIGMHQGALSLTIGLALRKQSGVNSEEYRWWARQVVRGRQPVGPHAPKTRKAIYYQGRWWPLGWIRLGPTKKSPPHVHSPSPRTSR